MHALVVLAHLEGQIYRLIGAYDCREAAGHRTHGRL